MRLIYIDLLEIGGGERGIRTLDRGLTYTPLAGERLQPLGHLSGGGHCSPLNRGFVDTSC